MLMASCEAVLAAVSRDRLPWHVDRMGPPPVVCAPTSSPRSLLGCMFHLSSGDLSHKPMAGLPAQASKSSRKAAPTSAIMSLVVMERPCFWKA